MRELIQSMGRPQFEMIVASAPREKMIVYDFSQNVTVPASGVFSVSLFAPQGFIGELNSMWLQAPSPASYGGATSGSHVFSLQDTESKILYTQSAQVYNDLLDFQQNHWEHYSNYNPTNEITVLQAVQSIKFDDKIGLMVAYFNLLNAQILNSPLKMRLIYKLRQVSGVS
jgi:hypothetical protein